MTMPTRYRRSRLDGTDSGGYVIMNVDAPMKAPNQIVEDDEGNTYFDSLEDARRRCAKLRRENANQSLYVYALVAVGTATRNDPSAFV